MTVFEQKMMELETLYYKQLVDDHWYGAYIELANHMIPRIIVEIRELERKERLLSLYLEGK